MRLNITPSTGRFLDLLIRELRPRHILELGTSQRLLDDLDCRAAQSVGATVNSVDIQSHKTTAAASNLAFADLREIVTLHKLSGK